MDIRFKFVKSPLPLPRGLQLVLAQILIPKRVQMEPVAWRAAQSRAAKHCVRELKRQFEKIPTRHSITHKDHWIAVALAPKAEFAHVGVDCEKILSYARAQKLARRIFTDAEAQSWKPGRRDFAKRVTLAFSLKEAAYKSLPKVRQKKLGFRNFELKRVVSRQAQIDVLFDTDKRPKIALKGTFSQFSRYILTLVYKKN